MSFSQSFRYILASLAFQRRNKFVSRVHNSKLSLSEFHLSGELYGNPNKTISEYVETMNMNQSSIFRSLNKFKKEGLAIENYLIQNDRNVKVFQLTPKGRLLHEKLSKKSADGIREIINDVKDSDLKMFIKFLKKMNDSMSAPETAIYFDDSPLRVEIRRQTKVFGIFGGNYLKSGYTNAQIQILSLVDDYDGELTQKELSSLFNLNQPAIAQFLKPIESSNLIIKVEDQNDSRIKKLKLSLKGEKIWSEVKRTMCHFVSRGLSLMTKDEIDDATTILERLSGSDDKAKLAIKGQPLCKLTYEVYKVTSNKMLALLKEQGIKCNIIEDETLYAYFQDNKVKLVLNNKGDRLYESKDNLCYGN